MDAIKFPELPDPVRKVEAVLATVRQPVSKQMILDFAGVDLTQVDDAQRQEIEKIFEKWKVDGSDDLFWVPTEQQAEVIQSIGVESKSVHGQITKIIMGRTGYGRPRNAD